MYNDKKKECTDKITFYSKFILIISFQQMLFLDSVWRKLIPIDWCQTYGVKVQHIFKLVVGSIWFALRDKEC